MKQTLEFTVTIAAPRGTVWDAMLGPDTYRDWTSVFCEGSYYEGSWDQGEAIRFLTPDGEGMSSVIAVNRPREYVSIRHLGTILGGIEDFTSEEVRRWAPAYESYAFVDVPGGTEVRVSVDVIPEYEEFMEKAFPQALARLKAICESATP